MFPSSQSLREHHLRSSFQGVAAATSHSARTWLRLLLRCVSLLLATAVASPLLHAQSLHFTAPIFNVHAVNGVTNANNVLSQPSGVAVDAAGNLYVADTNNELVRKVSPTQTATIFAGSGYGYSGDGGPATSARMKSPTSLAVDAAGNVYITDPLNYAVRKVDTNGIMTTVAGGNGNGSSGDGGQATSAQIVAGGIASDALGNLYIVDLTANSVRRVSTAGVIITVAGGGTMAGATANGGPATSAKFGAVVGVAFDQNGNLYIADYGFDNIRKVDSSGIITTFAGTSVNGTAGDGGLAVNAQFRGLSGISIDASGNMFIADGGSATVRMINAAGIISTVAGNGLSGQVLDGIPVDHAGISSPTSVAADTFGNLYIAVRSANAVYQVPMHDERFPQTRLGESSQPQRLVLENLGSADVQLGTITLNSDYALYAPGIINSNACTLHKVLQAGFSNYCTIDVVFTPTAEGVRALPLTVNSNDTPGTLIQTLTSNGLGSALAMTSGLLFNVGGAYSPNQTSDGPTVVGPSTSIHLSQITGLAVDSGGDIFFSQGAYCLIERIDGNTGIQSIFAGTNSIPCGSSLISGDGGAATAASIETVGQLTLDAANNLYMSDTFDGRIRKIDTAGKITTFAGLGVGVPPYDVSCGYSADGVMANMALLCNPQGMAFDSAGNMYFAETGNNVIRRISLSGVLSTVAGNAALNTGFEAAGGFSGDGGPATAARLNEPSSVAVAANGDVYISDTNNYVVRKVTAATGVITTIAGQHGVSGYSGDGGPATAATLSFPKGITLDAAGDVFVIERGNWTVRRIDTNGIITTVAGNALSEVYNGDGIPATEATLSFPDFVFMSPSGYLYIGDTDHELIREMSPNGNLLFPPTSVGTTSSPESATISNIGNLPLHFDSLFPTGITGDFALAPGGTCDFTATLAVGASCNVNLTFTPTAAGGRTGILGFFDDGVASPQYVALSGTGKQPQPQSITLRAVGNHRYGDLDFALVAATPSGLPITYSVKSGNATVTGSTIHITGIGPVTVAADQGGNSAWLPATEATSSFTITPAVLQVTASPETSTQQVPLVPLAYTITGFVYGENTSVVSGAPVLSTAVTPTSNPGYYPITVTAGNLSAANYTFVLVNGQYYMGLYQVPSAPVKLAVGSVIQRDGAYIISVTVTNSGGATAQNVVLTGLKLNSVAGTPASRTLGAIPAGTSASAAFTVPMSAGASGASVVEQINGTYTGGTFGGSSRVNLP